jgi:hypothetical protein
MKKTALEISGSYNEDSFCYKAEISGFLSENRKMKIIAWIFQASETNFIVA